MHTI
jgi:hypothetical protein